MQEKIRIRMQVDGVGLQIGQLSGAGLVVSGETSATPRGLSLILEPGNPITEFRMRRVRQIQDWAPQEFHLRIGVDGDSIVCQGVDALSLPAGGYSLRVVISDLIEQNQPADIDVPDDGTAEVTLQYKTDPRRLALTTAVVDFDPEIRRIVQDTHTLLDGMDAPDWLASASPRPRRKACFMNLLAKLRAAPAPRPNSALISDVASIFFGDVDRVYARVSSDLLADLHTLADDPEQPFYFEGAPKAAIHADLLAALEQFEPDGSLFTLSSFRQEGQPSMQAVIAAPPGGDPARVHYADLDIDLGNPLQDIEGAVIHFGELLAPGKTDHLKLAQSLAKGSTAPFMYYKVTKANAVGA